MNLVILIGRLGKAPDTKTTQSGMVVTNFSLATNKKVKGEDKTSWHRCVAFSKTAELIDTYIKKGDMLSIEGEINYGSYDKEGTTVYTTDILVNKVHFIGGKSSGGNHGNQGGWQNDQRRQPPKQDIAPPVLDSDPNDIIPF